MTPEHPYWTPWTLRLAEYDGRVVRLIDAQLRLEHGIFPEPHLHVGRYVVGAGPEDCDMAAICPAGDLPHWRNVWVTDDLAEAEAAFEEAERQLLAGPQ